MYQNKIYKKKIKPLQKDESLTKLQASVELWDPQWNI